MDEERLYGVQAVMYYANNGGCEADWFCLRCPFQKTFCDRLRHDEDQGPASEVLEVEAEKWMRENGVTEPWGWKPSNVVT